MKNSEIRDVQSYMNEIEIIAKVLNCTIEKAEDLLVEYSDLDVTALLQQGFHKAQDVAGNIWSGETHSKIRLKAELDKLLL